MRRPSSTGVVRRCARLAAGPVLVVGCGGTEPASQGAASTAPAPVADACLVRLHGKSERGAPPVEHADYLELAPDGNAADGRGRRWEYAAAADFAAARAAVAAPVEASGCERVVLHGFSNGAAFAAKLYCRGETFGGRVVGVVVDDPVPDTAVEQCRPEAAVAVALYWTGGLDELAVEGADCADIGWICDSETLLGIDRYAAALGTPVLPSVHDEHTIHAAAPEIEEWLGPVAGPPDTSSG